MSSLIVRMITWSNVLPGKVQQLTATPCLVTAMPVTRQGRVIFAVFIQPYLAPIRLESPFGLYLESDQY